MYAGTPEMGAVAAWREALTRIEELKLDWKPFCGGVADIAKFSIRSEEELSTKWLLLLLLLLQGCHR